MSQKKQISSFIKYMYPDNEVFELCVKHSEKGGMSSGFYKDEKKAAQAIMNADSKEPYGIYICANPPKRRSISGPVDHYQIGHGKRAEDDGISRIKHIVVDLDPIRPSNTSATPEQHEASLDLAKKIKGLMSKRKGWPEPAVLDTGNGSMLIYDVDLKNTPDNVKLVRGCLDWLDKKFSTDEVKVDTSVGNPGRLIRVPGTKNRKGPADDAGRPQRRAKIIMKPDEREVLRKKEMRRIVALRPETTKKKQSHNNGGKTILDVEAYLKAYGVKYLEPKDWHGGKLYPLKACPFDPDDKPGDASIIQDPEGTLYFQCFHQSCKGNKWSDFRRKISQKNKLDRFLIQKKAATKQHSLSLIRADKLVQYTRHEPPLINGILERHGMLLIRGPAGIGKSMLALNVALNIANPPSDKALWSKFLVMNKARVLIVQSENSRNSLKKRLSKMTKKNPRYEEAMSDIYYLKSKDVCTVSGNLQDVRFMKSIKKSIVRKDIGLVIIDPLISYHEEDENNNRGMRQALQVITDLCETFKVAAIVIHHDGKSESSCQQAAKIDPFPALKNDPHLFMTVRFRAPGSARP